MLLEVQGPGNGIQYRHSYSSFFDYNLSLLKDIYQRHDILFKRCCIGSCSDLSISFAGSNISCTTSPINKYLPDLSFFKLQHAGLPNNTSSNLFNFNENNLHKVSDLADGEESVGTSLESHPTSKSSFNNGESVLRFNCYSHKVKRAADSNKDCLNSGEISRTEEYEDFSISFEDECEVFETPSGFYDICGTDGLEVDATPKHSYDIQKRHLRGLIEKQLIPRKQKRARTMRSNYIPKFMLRQCLTPSPKSKTVFSTPNTKNSDECMRNVRVRTSTPASTSYQEEQSSFQTDCCYSSYLDYINSFQHLAQYTAERSLVWADASTECSSGMVRPFCEKISEYCGQFGISVKSFDVYKEIPFFPPGRDQISKIFALGTALANLGESSHGLQLQNMAENPFPVLVDLPTEWVYLTFEIQSLPRPMSVSAKVLMPKDSFTLAKSHKSAGRQISENRIVPLKEGNPRNKIPVIMGNGSTRQLSTNKLFITARQGSLSYDVQRRRYGPREVHKNIWRLEKKAIPGKTITRESETVDLFLNMSMCCVM